MGQTFDIAAPRAGQMIQMCGLMTEILFDGSARNLVNALVVPRRLKRASREANSRLASPNSAAKHQARSTSIQSSTWSEKTKGPCVGNGTVDLLSLPVELLCYIFDELEFIQDVLSLGMANRHLWRIAEENLEQYYRSFYGQLSNQNIVCFGEYTEPHDYPPGIFSDAEIQHLQRCKFGDMVTVDADFDWGGEADMLEHPFTPYDFTMEEVAEEVKTDVDLRSEYIKLLGYFCRKGILDDCAFQAVSPGWAIDSTTYVPEDRPWILRNLTTTEFVRSEAIALRPEFIHGPYIEHIGFGEVILSRIGWTSHDREGKAKPGTIYRGVWAGHRFDIVDLASHDDDASASGVQWTDVSSEVADEIAKIWEEVFGENWRDDITK
ncbi:hypothetical protein QQS21_005826 [Conoideocrella luteorostrata]|uniref:F-box domain-containing protein n=1 Tax=Conoideocrella luteorostrata TaxID=1105319 RepID=A0AAJ0CNQ5_9HYPO|nr:hypothetical protein QQS21_005826 [Conoideocrella luteorostrata]